MADAAARREARRKRILENSENRLLIISGAGRTGDSETSPVTVQDVPSLSEQPAAKKEFMPDSDRVDSKASSSSYNQVHYTPSHELENVFSSAQLDDTEEEPFVPMIGKQTGNVPERVIEPRTLIAIVLATRLHLVGLAVLVHLLLSLNYSYLFAESIFVPLFTFTVLKYCRIIPDPNNTQTDMGMLNAALVLSGLSARKVGLFKKVIGGVKDFVVDFYVYFFSFIVLHVLLESTLY